MGLYNKIEQTLSKQFSIFQLMTLLGIGASEVRLVRNLLKQFHQQGYIKRIGKNMYEKIEKYEKTKSSKTKEKRGTQLKEEKIPKTREKKRKSTKQKLISLTELHGLGSKTEEKFISLGIKSVNELVKENPSDLAKLIHGASKNTIEEWIEEGKKLIGT
jgi:predicted flap endonuclease-1-like 5' DNA nuclease